MAIPSQVLLAIAAVSAVAASQAQNAADTRFIEAVRTAISSAPLAERKAALEIVANSGRSEGLHYLLRVLDSGNREIGEVAEGAFLRLYKSVSSKGEKPNAAMKEYAELGQWLAECRIAPETIPSNIRRKLIDQLIRGKADAEPKGEYFEQFLCGTGSYAETPLDSLVSCEIPYALHLVRSKGKFREEILSSLIRYAPEQLRPALPQLAVDRSPSIRCSAISMIATRRFSESYDAIVAASSDTNSWVRAQAAHASEALGSTAAKPLLKRLTSDKVKDLRELAKQLLAAMPPDP